MFYFNAKVHKSQKSSVNSVLCQTKMIANVYFSGRFEKSWISSSALLGIKQTNTGRDIETWVGPFADCEYSFCFKFCAKSNLSLPICLLFQCDKLFFQWFVSPDYMFWKYRSKIIKTLQCNDHGPVMFCCLHSPRSLCNVILVLVPKREVNRQGHLWIKSCPTQLNISIIWKVSKEFQHQITLEINVHTYHIAFLCIEMQKIQKGGVQWQGTDG